MNFLNLSLTYLSAAVACILLAVGIALFGKHRRRSLLHAIGDPSMLTRLTPSLHAGKRRIRTVLFIAAVLLALLAGARPWWGSRRVPTPERSRAIVVALDVSRSMLARDVPPNRLEHAKNLIRQIMERSPGDRFALVLFAGDAFLQCPLTQDHNTLLFYLHGAGVDSISRQGTNLARGLDEALAAFDGVGNGDRIVLLVSDGEELQGDVFSRVNRFAENAVDLAVVGVGRPGEGTLIQLDDSTYVRDPNGNPVRTRLDETRLHRLAQAVDGLYVRSTAGTPNINPVVNRIQSLIPEQFEDAAARRPVERFQAPLAAALLCLIARLCMSERKREAPGYAAAAAVVAAAVLLGSQPMSHAAGNGNTDPAAAGPREPAAADLPATDHEAADRTGRIRQALEELAAAGEQDRPRLLYNLGVHYQQAGYLEQAKALFDQALDNSQPNTEIYAAALWNRGLTHHLLGRQALKRENLDSALAEFETAGRNYRDALAYRPGAADLALNQEILLTEIHRTAQAKRTVDELRRRFDLARTQTVDALKQHRETAAKAGAPGFAHAAGDAAVQSRRAADAAAELGDLLDALAIGTTEEDVPNPGHSAADQLRAAAHLQERAAHSVRTRAAERRMIANAARHLQHAARLLGIDPNATGADPTPHVLENAEDQPPDPADPRAAEQHHNAHDEPGIAATQPQQPEPMPDHPPTPREVPRLDEEQANELLLKMQNQERDIWREQHMRKRHEAIVIDDERDW